MEIQLNRNDVSCNQKLMGFGVIDLFKLTLKRQIVPIFDGISGKHFPERIPTSLIVLCFINSLVKLLTPLILEQTYSSISSSHIDTYHYLTLISIVIISIALSQFILIAYGLMLALYTLNVKRELSARILTNNFQDYKSLLESASLSQKADSFNMELSIKISTKLSVYVHNYYQSYLSLIFECFNIVVIFIYLLYKLSFSLFFGVAIAGCVMYKTILTANLMQSIRFDNIARRARRLKILEAFFAKITQFKMCWLDQWIYDRITKIENQFQEGLRKIKMLDCWCVALWQFTSVGISSIVISAYFLLGLNQKVEKDSVFTPSTFVYLLGMLNFPLNALSWYIAGIKTAHRAIKELQQDIKIQTTNSFPYKKIQSNDDCFLIKEPIILEFKYQNNSEKFNRKMQLPIRELPKGKIYSVSGIFSEHFMDKFVFLFEDSIARGFVEQNSWLSSSPLQAFRMQQNLTHLQNYEKQQIVKLMQLFLCGDIPLNTSTINYSGGEKLRISLVRAFHLGQLIIINTNLQSLDLKMQNNIKQVIRKLVDRSYVELKKEYTVFIRDNQDISDYLINLIENNGTISPVIRCNNEVTIIKEQIDNIVLSPQIQKFRQEFILSLQKANQKMQGKRRRYSMQKFQQLDKMKQKSVVQWSTFKLYYKSKKHIAFVIALLFVTFLSNYYNYYINTYIKLIEYNQHQVIVIIIITIIFAIGLYFRSFYFADANLDQSYRICNTLNKNIVMNELSFYNSEEIIQENTQSINSKSKMICALTSDTETISDQFPFSTNIFANNITVIISSMIVIIIEVPPMIIIMVFLVIYANKLNKISHKKDEYLKIVMKEKDVDVYRTISEIQNGRKYIIIHNKFQKYSEQYIKHQQQLFSIDWLSSKFKNYINLKYKTAMILFLIIAVILYSIMKVFTSNQYGNQQNQQSKSSSGLALLIQYTIQLSNYLLYFTMSIWQIKGQAISLERIKPYIDQTQTIKNRVISAEKIIKKLKNIDKLNNSTINHANSSLISINNLDFRYQSNPDISIFNNLNLQIKKGDKIIIKGPSGSGKTTLYKLLSSTYPNIMNFVDSPFIIYFSPQHPLILPDTQSVQQNINPYGISLENTGIAKLQQSYLESHKVMKELNYEQKIIINNLRAFLYGGTGIIIYDQPQIAVEDNPQSTYIIVTHHRQFKHNIAFQLQNGRLIRKMI